MFTIAVLVIVLFCVIVGTIDAFISGWRGELSMSEKTQAEEELWEEALRQKKEAYKDELRRRRSGKQ